MTADSKDPQELLKEFSKRMHATLVAASSNGCTLPEFCKLYQADWGSKYTVKWYAEQANFQTVAQMIHALKDEVTYENGILKAKQKEETKDVQDLIDRSQANKIANQKKRKNALPAWASNPPPSRQLFDNLPPAPPGFRASTSTPGLGPRHNFIRPPISLNQPSAAWSFNSNNWPSPLSQGVPPGYVGPSAPRVAYQQWSSVNENHPTPSKRPPLLSNVSALQSKGRNSTGANLYHTSLPPQLSSLTACKSLFAQFSNVDMMRQVQNQLDGQDEVFRRKDQTRTESSTEGQKPSGLSTPDSNRSSPLGYRVRRTPQGFTLDEVEEGEIVDEEDGKDTKDVKTKPSGDRLSEQMASCNIDDEDDFGYDSKDESEECHNFLAKFVVRRIPPHIHRIVYLLKAAGGSMTFKDLQARYEKKYLRKLTNVELRNVLGTPEAKNTLVAFQRSPMAYLFRYELTIAGNGIVKLLVDPNDKEQIEAVSQENGNEASTSNAISRSTSVSSISANMVSGASVFRQSARPSSTASGRVTPLSMSSDVKMPPVNEIPMPPTSEFSMPPLGEIPMPPGTPRSPVVLEESVAKPQTPTTPFRELSRCARDLLAFATTAYDLTSNTPRRLQDLHSELRKQDAFHAFTHSPAQIIGLLMEHFDKCFQVVDVHDSDQRKHCGVAATEVKPTEMVERIQKFPKSLHEFPSVAESMTFNIPTYAYITSHEITEFGTIRFVAHLAAHEKTRSRLRTFLNDYDRLLKDSREAPLPIESLICGQRVLYRTSKCLRRCRVVRVGSSLSDVCLQCIDRGRTYDHVLENSIFEFLPDSQLSPERFPALAVRCEFADGVNVPIEEARELFTKLESRGTVVKISILDSYILADFMTIYKVELLLGQKGQGDNFQQWPAKL